MHHKGCTKGDYLADGRTVEQQITMNWMRQRHRTAADTLHIDAYPILATVHTAHQPLFPDHYHFSTTITTLLNATNYPLGIAASIIG